MQFNQSIDFDFVIVNPQSATGAVINVTVGDDTIIMAFSVYIIFTKITSNWIWA